MRIKRGLSNCRSQSILEDDDEVLARWLDYPLISQNIAIATGIEVGYVCMAWWMKQDMHELEFYLADPLSLDICRQIRMQRCMECTLREIRSQEWLLFDAELEVCIRVDVMYGIQSVFRWLRACVVGDGLDSHQDLSIQAQVADSFVDAAFGEFASIVRTDTALLRQHCAGFCMPIAAMSKYPAAADEIVHDLATMLLDAVQ